MATDAGRGETGTAEPQEGGSEARNEVSTDPQSDDRADGGGRSERWVPADRDAIREPLLSWYDREGRDLPIRDATDPYPILVAEIMSQQTQLDRVVPAWEAFLDRWPTVASLAAADRSAVVSFWSEQRLGYNNRARYLHEAATQVVEEFGGEIPGTVSDLEQLQGVGPYTATAVASFAFGAPAAVVDTNVKRVLHRALGVPDDETAFRAAADALIPADHPRDWNDAMMDLGAMVCTPTPDCPDCPWQDWCLAHRTGDYTAPDVPTQPQFEGSRRQMRGRIVRILGESDELSLDELGPRVRVDYAPDGDHGRDWLRELLSDLSDDGLVETTERDGAIRARLQE